MDQIKVEKTKVDLATGISMDYVATVQREKDATHQKYSLTYEGYISEWTPTSEGVAR